MQIVISSCEKDLAASGQDVVRQFYPDAMISLQPSGEADILVEVSATRKGRELTGAAQMKTKTDRLYEKVSTDTIPVPGDDRNHQKRLVKLAVFRLLCRYTGTAPGPWGILTGIRPTKIVHRLLDLGWEDSLIREYLAANYDMAAAKISLLIDIALRQRAVLLSEKQARQMVSVYIGIPFCPTRCAYCSFPAYPAAGHGGLVEPFLQALHKEIITVGKAMSELGIGVQTIYLGGGTPTVLDREQLENLLRIVREYLISGDTIEFTLEAGRPDTITRDKLKVAREYGVTRLTVNPQSMNRGTLEKIGRCHSPDDIVSSFELARELGYVNINMDLIAGLPGEKAEDVVYSLEQVAKLGPENLTVHTLAVKRASRIKETRAHFDLPAGEEVEQMLKAAAAAAKSMGMHPYYLYRQKKMVGPLENVGYARPGWDCVYNIQIIEERQTIIGLGGGAGSKFVEPGTWYLTSLYNPKDPEAYIARQEELAWRKIKNLRGLRHGSR